MRRVVWWDMRTLPLLLLITAFAAGAAEPVSPAPPAAAGQAPAQAQSKDKVYKWTDDKGVVHYTDKPPRQGAKPAQLPPLQSYESRSSIPNMAPSEPPPAAPKKVSIQIVSPAADEVYRNADSKIAVAVVVSPALEEGRQLRYFLDSAPQGGPTDSTSKTFSGLERGSHSIAVAVVDTAGRELARSSVRVQLQTPSTLDDAGGSSSQGRPFTPRAPTPITPAPMPKK
jgi:hypothetical protein